MCTVIILHYVLAHLHKYTLSFPAHRHISQVNILLLAFDTASNSPLSPKEGCSIQLFNTAESTERVTILIVVGIAPLL